MSDEHVLPIKVAILGADALLAARPVDPIQLTRACLTAGFDFVAPVSWGEELIATHLAERVDSVGSAAVVASSCPFVSEQLRSAPVKPPVLKTVPPPVACARYLRAVLRPRPVHVTFIGACPGAVDLEVDTHLFPDVLFARLLEAGVEPSMQPRHLDGRMPVERARHASTPGGTPWGDWLEERSGTRLVEAAPITVDAVAQMYRHESILIDLTSACGCRCARDRVDAARLEPPRSSRPVVANDIVCVDADEPRSDQALSPLEGEPKASADEPTERDRRATFAENGLSAGEAPTLPPVPSSLMNTREPW
jgi:hypothetical protein